MVARFMSATQPREAPSLRSVCPSLQNIPSMPPAPSENPPPLRLLSTPDRLSKTRPSERMNVHALDLLTPSILVLDDEKQIHSSLRLRLGNYYQLVCLSNPREAIALI